MNQAQDEPIKYRDYTETVDSLKQEGWSTNMSVKARKSVLCESVVNYGEKGYSLIEEADYANGGNYRLYDDLGPEFLVDTAKKHIQKGGAGKTEVDEMIRAASKQGNSYTFSEVKDELRSEAKDAFLGEVKEAQNEQELERIVSNSQFVFKDARSELRSKRNSSDYLDPINDAVAKKREALKS